MKIKLLLLLISIVSLNTNTAQYCVGKYKKKLLPSSKTIVIPSRKLPSCKAPIGGNQDVIFLICKHYENLSDAAKMVNALAQTNKFLNTLINDDNRILKLIKSLSVQFDCSNMAVAELLCTKEANIRYLLQKSLMANWTGGDRTVKTFSKLKSMGVDLNFTYNKNETPLFCNIWWEEIGYAQVGEWLIKNGADINVVDKNGRNILMCAIEKDNKALIPLLLEHDSLKVHHQDKQGNTVLHYCIKALAYLAPMRYYYISDIIDQLLKKGANSTTKNMQNKSALDLCLEYQIKSCEPIIKLLEEAR